VRISAGGLVVAVAVVTGVIGGVYVVAASTASSMARTFTTAESDQRASRAESQGAMTRASARYATALEHCEQYKYAKRELCHSAARRDGRWIVPADAPTKERAP